MTIPRSRITLVAALLVGMLLASACGSTGTGHGPVGYAAARPEPTSPAQAAQVDAASLLSAFVPPSGASAAASEPSGTPPAMNVPVFEPSVTTNVSRTGWWTVDTPAHAVYSWLTARYPGGGAGTYGATSANRKGPAAQFITYSEPATAQLAQRTVLIAVGSLSSTRTVLRVDAQVLYHPAKPAAEVIPATAYLLATAQPSTAPGASKPNPIVVAVTDHSTITEIAGLFNALPEAIDAAYSCPLSIKGAVITLAFKTAVNGTTRATVTFPLRGCGGGVSLTIDGAHEPPLDTSVTTYPGGLGAQLTSILGITLH